MKGLRKMKLRRKEFKKRETQKRLDAEAVTEILWKTI